MFKLRKKIEKQDEQEQELPWHYRLQIQRYSSNPILVIEEGKNNIVRIRKLPESQDEDYEVIRFNELTNDFSMIRYSRFHDVKEVERVIGYEVEFELDTKIETASQHIQASDISNTPSYLLDIFQPISSEVSVDGITITLDRTWKIHITKLALCLMTLGGIQDEYYDSLMKLLKQFYLDSGITIDSQIKENENNHPTIFDFYLYICIDKNVKTLEICDEIKTVIKSLVRMQNIARKEVGHASK